MAHYVPGQFVFYDYHALDPDEAAAFYTHVIGWTTRPFRGGFTLFEGCDGAVSSTLAMSEETRKRSACPRWTAAVLVTDVDGTVALAVELGGRVLEPAWDDPGVGRLAVIADPQGAELYLFDPGHAMNLHDRAKPREYTWRELLAADHASAFAFYARLFGWKKSREVDMGPAGTYLVFGLGDGTDLGGMMTKPENMPAPPHWLYYVEIADLDAAIARATSKGGKLLNGPEEVPRGRIAQLLDSQGGAFALHEAKR